MLLRFSRPIYILAQDLQRLRAANGGQSTAFDRMLDIAYGRVGKLRHELMEVNANVHVHFLEPHHVR